MWPLHADDADRTRRRAVRGARALVHLRHVRHVASCCRNADGHDPRLPGRLSGRGKVKPPGPGKRGRGAASPDPGGVPKANRDVNGGSFVGRASGKGVAGQAVQHRMPVALRQFRQRFPTGKLFQGVKCVLSRYAAAVQQCHSSRFGVWLSGARAKRVAISTWPELDRRRGRVSCHGPAAVITLNGRRCGDLAAGLFLRASRGQFW